MRQRLAKTTCSVAVEDLIACMNRIMFAVGDDGAYAMVRFVDGRAHACNGLVCASTNVSVRCSGSVPGQILLRFLRTLPPKELICVSDDCSEWKCCSASLTVPNGGVDVWEDLRMDANMHQVPKELFDVLRVAASITGAGARYKSVYVTMANKEFVAFGTDGLTAIRVRAPADVSLPQTVLAVPPMVCDCSEGVTELHIGATGIAYSTESMHVFARAIDASFAAAIRELFLPLTVDVVEKNPSEFMDITQELRAAVSRAAVVSDASDGALTKLCADGKTARLIAEGPRARVVDVVPCSMTGKIVFCPSRLATALRYGTKWRLGAPIVVVGAPSKTLVVAARVES